ASNRLGVSAVVLAAVAITGGSPAASSAGKVTMAAPPTIAAMMPPAIPAPTSRRMCSRSIARATRRAAFAAGRSEERLNPGLRPAEDQGVDIVGALIGVDSFQVAQHAHHMKFVGDAVAAVHVARGARDL